MSGGAFDYKESSLKYIKEDLEELIKNNNIKDKNGYSTDYTEEELSIFKYTANECERLYKLLKAIDYYLESDTGVKDMRKAYQEYIREGRDLYSW